MGDSESRDKDSVTEVAEESFVRERPLEIERGAVLAGRYQVEEVIGKGGSGVVLRVFDRTVQNVVALKVLKSELARDTKWDKRFSRELRLGRPIQHPNVCRIFDIGEADGHRFLTMELATGGSLRDELKRRPALERPIEDRLKDARAAISGLAAIHSGGVVHRDFKPDNLLRMEDGRLVISDFGLATDAAAAPGVTVMIGTPHYMAPEVLAGEPATTRSDVWALGVVLYEIMFGRRPERRSVSFSGTERTVTVPSSRERAILSLLERCLEEAPRDRPSDARVVAQDFEHVAAGRASRRTLKVRWLAVLIPFVLAVASYPSIARRVKRANPATSEVRSARVAPTGAPADWRPMATQVAAIPGRIHCFLPLDAHTVRVVWGEPRVAEDVAWPQGQRSRSPISAETFRVGCPDVAPDRQHLLFTGRTESGASEIRLSKSPDGSHSAVITSGSNPLWLNNDEFVYDIDLTHVAIFTLANRELALLPAVNALKGFGIADKAVAVGGAKVAVLYTSFADRAIALFDVRTLTLDATIATPGAAWVQFGATASELLISYQPSQALSGLATVNWRSQAIRSWGRYSPFDIRFARLVESGEWMAARRVQSDAWTDMGGGPRQLTADGQTSGVAALRSGELLLSRRNESGRVNIWLVVPGSPERQLTFGEADVAPGLSPDIGQWAYADYSRRRVMFCSQLTSGSCRALYEDEALATGPAFSPDGAALSVITQLRTPKVLVLSVPDGKVQGSWDSVRQCPPVWSAEGKIWSLESEGAQLHWAEHLKSGPRTGHFIQAASANLSPRECWPSGVVGPDALLRAWTVSEETSVLLEVPGDRPE